MFIKEKASVVLVRLALQTLAGSVLLAGAAHAQDAATSGATDKPAVSADKAAPQKVYVTGSNVRRITLESASPVQVLTREEMTRTGATSLNEVLRNISSNVGGVSENRAGGFSAGAAGLNLRGVGSQATLVLINGRRLAPYAQPEFQTTFVDLNSIPIGAVERVEILKDGASAIYGSEAMAGVVNIILRNNYEGVELGGSVGQSSRGDGEQLRSTLSFGGGNLVKDHFNAYATIDLRSRAPMFLSKRDDYLSTQDTRAWGYKDARSLYTFPGNLYWTDKATGKYVARPIGGSCPADRLVDFSTRVANGAGQSCVFDDYRDGTFNAAGKTKRASITSRLTWQPSASTTLFSELMFNRNKAEITGDLHWFAGQIGQPMPDLPITHPQYPKDLIGADGKTLVGGNGSVRVRASLRDVAGQGQDNTTDFGRYLFGAKGDFKNWDWESALLLTTSKVTSDRTSGLLFDPLLAAYQNGSFQFGGAGNAALYNSMLTGTSNVFKSGLQQLDAKLSGELMTLPAGAVGLALGIEARREYLDSIPDPLSVDGALYHSAQSPPGFSNSRRIASVFGEATIPLIKNVEAQLAARFDHYSDYGNSTTPKVGLKWAVTPALMLRGTYAGGFRAPTLVENSTDVRNAWQSFTDPLRCNAQFKLGCNGGAQSPYQSGANPALKPETAKSMTLGLAWEPSSNFLATLDVWQIKRIDEISTYSLDRVLADPARYANNPAASITRSPLTDADRAAGALAGEVSNITMLLTNVAVTQVRGLDLKLQGKLNLGEYGTLNPALYVSHTQSFKTAPTPEEDLIEYAGTSDTPSFQATLGLSWKKAAYALSADTVFVSKTASVADRTQPCSMATEGFADLCKGMASYTVVNLGASYTGFKDLKLSLAVQNAFDRKPPFAPGSVGNYNQTLHSAMGRYIQLTADYKFK